MKAIVTGAARGLGAGVAERLVADGGAVALLDAIPEVEQTAARLASAVEAERTAARHASAGDAAAPAAVLGLVADIADERQVERAFAAALDALGGVDLLVNCAGIGGPGEPLPETDAAAFRRTLDVNVLGTFLACRAVARPMIEQRAGCIVNVGSVFGQQAVAFGGAYCASKGAVALLTQSLALELAPHGVRVNTVAPGHMESVMHFDELRDRAERAGTTFEQEVAKAREVVPLGRHGDGADVAGAVVWLASPDASYVTGQTIGVNGGLFLT